MTTSTVRCICKAFGVITAPIRALLVDTFLFVLVEFMKFCLVLLLAFGLGYLLFNLWNMAAEHRQSQIAGGELRQDRLSAGLIQNGSFSKFPYVIEMSTKTSGEVAKTNKKQKVYEKQVNDGNHQQ